MLTFTIAVALIGGVLGAAGTAWLWWVLSRRARRSQGGRSGPSVFSPATEASAQMITERVRAAGKLVGLEVCAKEIATATKGLSWMPPAILSQARLAMIFHFEKQYHADLSTLTERDVVPLGDGRYRLVLPAVHGTLRLNELVPYDIQSGRILGLLDVIPMNARSQGELMKRAQAEASELFGASDPRYEREAKRAIRHQLSALVSFFDAEVEIVFADELREVGEETVTPAIQSREQRPAIAAGSPGSPEPVFTPTVRTPALAG